MSNRPLGLDRHGTQYYTFLSVGGLYCRTVDDEWRVYRSASAMDALLAGLDRRGIHERALKERLQRDRDVIVASFRGLAKDVPATAGGLGRKRDGE